MNAPVSRLDPAAPLPVLLFLHIPKTGGTTLNKLVYEAYDPDVAAEDSDEGGYFNYGIYHFPGGFYRSETRIHDDAARVLQRPDLRIVLGHFSFGIHELVPRPAAYITFLRDPVERVVSLCAHELEWSNRARSDGGAGDVEELVVERTRAELCNDQTWRLSGESDPQRCNEETLERAKASLRSRFLAIGITERFDESLVVLKRTLGWDDIGYIPRLVNPRRRATSELSPEVIELIREQNRFDVELYECACRLLDDAIGRQDSTFGGEVDAFTAANQAHIRANSVG